MSRSTLLSLLLVLLGAKAQELTCPRIPGHTGAGQTPGDNGFRIKVAGGDQMDEYTPGQVYTIIINGTYPNQQMLGFMLVAVPQYATDETTAMGNFQNMPNGLTKLHGQCPHIVTHTYLHRTSGAQVLWTAPPSGAGCVELRATVIEHQDIWYKDDGALTKILCEETARTEDEVSSHMIPDCCACGIAKYQVTFNGKWSRHTHPKDYPDEEHRGLLHWSNIAGASHNKHYMIWQYGDYASRGVKEVCEFGFTHSLEEEMKIHSHDIRTVIKTSGIWWSDPDGLNQERWARFSVDRKNHLLSLLTMIGPSPDWCVGVSALNLCLPNCTWTEDVVIDLYPWDAGTDDGITYLSLNHPSDPQQKITKITNTQPDNPKSPFFGANPVTPVGKLHIKRIQKKPGHTDQCNDVDVGGESEESDDSTGSCATTRWSDWTRCSVTCGVGIRQRSRSYLQPSESRACTVQLQLTEKCIGIQNHCEGVDAECGLTEWTDWSPCSVTCGVGTQRRQRHYFRPEQEKSCNRNTLQTQPCYVEPDCETALDSKNFTAICLLPVDYGRCRGNFERWYYDSDSQQCLKFAYTGCRGNNNRFKSTVECQLYCGQLRLTPVEGTTSSLVSRGNDCAVSDWSAWSACSATCGKAFKYRRRIIEQPAGPGGKKCPSKLERKKRCKQNSCQPTECELGEWGQWSPCTKTCGNDAIQERSRPIIRRGSDSDCDTHLERRLCQLPPCGSSSQARKQG